MSASEDRKVLRELTERAVAQGWHVQLLKSGHTMFFPPDRLMPPVTVGGSVSDHRAWKNNIARLKRSGMRFDGALGAVVMESVPRFVLSGPDVKIVNNDSTQSPVEFFVVHPGGELPITPAVTVLVDRYSTNWNHLRKLPQQLSELEYMNLYEISEREETANENVRYVHFWFSQRAHDAYAVFIDKLEELHLR